jgi:hypothetical protein
MPTRTNYKKAYFEHKGLTMRNVSLHNDPELAKNHFQMLVAYMHAAPIRVNTNLYRGLNTNLIRKLLKNGYLNDNYLSSFSKNKNVAIGFTRSRKNNNNLREKVLILKPGIYPAINEKKNRISNGNTPEREVTIAPGRYTLMGVTPNGNIRVNYTPKKIR